jgi:hypothetical protein
MEIVAASKADSVDIWRKSERHDRCDPRGLRRKVSCRRAPSPPQSPVVSR